MKTPLLLLGILLVSIITFNSSCQKQTDYSPQINSLQQQINNLLAQQSAIYTLQTSLNNLQKRTDSLAHGLATTTLNLNVANSNISNQSTLIEDIQTRVSSINVQIASLNTELNTTNVNITNIQTQIVDLSNQYNSLILQTNMILAKLGILPKSLKTGLVAWFPFNGNANDESGNGNNGIVNGAKMAIDRFGNRDAAYSFNQNYILINNITQYNLNNFSISLWVSSTNTKRQIPLIKLNYDNAANEHFAIALNDLNKYGVEIACKYNNPNCISGQGWQRNECTKNILDGSYHHIVGTVEGNLMSIYVDGTLYSVLTAPSIQSSSCFGGDIQIGRNWSNFTDYFIGGIDDVGLWNRTLAPSEISYLANH